MEQKLNFLLKYTFLLQKISIFQTLSNEKKNVTLNFEKFITNNKLKRNIFK